MGAHKRAAYLREIGGLEDEARQLQANGARRSSEAREDLALCKESCRAARSSLAKNEIDAAPLRILEAKLHLDHARSGQKNFEDLRDSIADELVATLPEARRRVFKRLYPNLSGRAKHRAEPV